MNNKTLAWVITALVAALAVILVIVCTKLDTFVEPFDGINHWWEISSKSESESESESEESASSEESESSSEEPFEPIYDGAAGVEEWPDDDESVSSATSSVIHISGNGSSSRPSYNSSSSSSSSSSGSSESSSDSSSDTSSDSGEADDGKMTYEKYIALSPEEQQKYYNSFASVEAFFNWLNAAKAEYEANRDEIEVDGEIDIGDYINP